MPGVGLWKIESGLPSRVGESEIALEAELEAWIEADPSLVESGLVIVGRQMTTPGGPLDLLALDRIGRWVLIEIKRGRLRREVVAQAVDYASCIDLMSPEELRSKCNHYLSKRGEPGVDDLLAERGQSLEGDEPKDLVLYLVGFGYDLSLQRMVDYLADRANLPIRLVTFTVLSDSGSTFLARQVRDAEVRDTEARPPGRTRSSRQAFSSGELLRRADANGIGDVIRPLVEAAESLGMYARAYAKSFMLAPMGNKTRCLLYAPVEGPKASAPAAKVYCAASTFVEFFGCDRAAVLRVMPDDDWLELRAEAVVGFIDSLRGLVVSLPQD